ncbi:MAG: glycerol-3-phosphate acyltransferase [Anaerolineae bacterium]|nr:glycerol-3-phosphate acyltransferase [Anaerolineae bacterium]
MNPIMTPVLTSILSGLLGYLIGSIPFGWIVVKLAKGVDIRTVGSGRTGGTNAFRAAGFVPGLLTATLDIIKGAVTVLVVRNLAGDSTLGWAEGLAGLGVVLGHNHSLFLNFKGGAGGRNRSGHWAGTLGDRRSTRLGHRGFHSVCVGLRLHGDNCRSPNRGSRIHHRRV